jgi:hypothetical protein
LRAQNAARWQERARRMLTQRDADAADESRSSGIDRRFADDDFDVGAAAAWILANEDGGFRV